MKARSFNLALALAATGFALSPAAQAAETGRAVTVVHADLDLSTEEGKAELDRRIDHAAKEACGYNEAQVGTLIRTREQRTCYRQAKRQFDNHFAQIIEYARRGG